ITWQEMFSQAPAPYGLTAVQANGAIGSSGLALGDLPVPLGNYEAHVQGNRVLGGTGGPDIYIAGLVYISSHSLNTGAGFINFIDYTKGEMRVGGFIGDPTTGARVRINDPSGEFGRVNSPDIRFTVDPQNPTIMSGTGFPMCFPRTDPAVADDPLCPQAQRPIAVAGNPPQYAATINTNDPRIPGLAGVPPDANFQAPFEVGDYIIFAGILATDTGRGIHLYALDNDPLTGAVTDRDWGTIGVDPGPPNGAVRGRWRFRPPCAPFGTVPAAPEKQCVMNAAQTFLPPPREVRIVIEGAWTPASVQTAANGLIWGQYHAPLTE